MANCKLWRYFATMIATAVLVPGCGEQDWGHLNGTVTVNGQPAGPGTLTLQPVDGDRVGGRASFGEDGKYSVISAGRKEGAPVGEYRLLVYGGEDFGSEEVGPRPKSKIPAKYSNPNTSDLTVTIEPGTKTVDFDLKP